MKSILILLLIAFLPLLSGAAAPSDRTGLIPKPFKMTQHEGHFLLNAKTPIVWENEKAAPVAQLFCEGATRAFGLKLQAKSAGRFREGIIFIYDKSVAGEEYTLSVTPSAITVRGSESGLFYGLQTLLQLMPPDGDADLRIPCTDIYDKPRFGHRGAMLDVGRYFFPPQAVKRFIDLMAFYKLNVLHFHLTEDGGWRMEIKKYPELTRIGAWRRTTHIGRKPDTFDRLPHGGYYTQAELRDLVAYAQSKHITIVPEIDMPGHMLAALAGYPHLSCTGGPFKVLEQWGIQKDVLCAGNEETYQFVEGVLEEVIDVFPSEIIHIGGDEAPKDRWKACQKCQAKMAAENLKDEHELQSYFIRRVASFLGVKGRRLLGWDEILEGGIAPNAMVMSWRGEEGGITAARQSHDVIMTPNKFCYLDYYQSKPENEPFNIGGNLPLEKVYDYEPLPAALEPEFHKHVMGLQGNIWMEYIHTEPKLDYMAFPRLLAIAETGWSEKGKDYHDFLQRLGVNLLWLDKERVNYRIPEPRGLADTVSDQESVTVQLEPPVKGAIILYTLDGSDPLSFGLPYSGPVTIRLSEEPVKLQCVVRTPVGRVSATYSAAYSKKTP